MHAECDQGAYAENPARDSKKAPADNGSYRAEPAGKA
jgi:hypothetical protein